MNNNNYKFDSKNILDFANKNGWTLVDSSVFSNDITMRWEFSGKAVFPLSSTGFSDKALHDKNVLDFPRWFGGLIKVYSFKTGWITIDPGTDKSIEENGFLLISNDKKEIAVYHLWGE